MGRDESSTASQHAPLNHANIALATLRQANLQLHFRRIIGKSINIVFVEAPVAQNPLMREDDRL